MSHIKKIVLFTMIGIVLALSAAVVVQAGSTKVQVCHIPPGNPDNFHTITISEKAFSAHLAHGDLGGACDAACAALCDDGDACTIDDTGDCEQMGCPATPEQVDCNDQNDCTNDSCNAASGCVNTPRIGEICDDGQICSGPDTCDAQGECQGAAIANCCLSDDDCSGDPCDQASCDFGTNRCGEDPKVCTPEPPSLCAVSECAPDTGECVDSAVVCGDGESCNEGTGECEAEVVYTDACPCFRTSDLEALPVWGPTELHSAESWCRNSGGVEGSDWLRETALTGEFYYIFARYGSQRYCSINRNGAQTLINPLSPSAMDACIADVATFAQQRGYTCFDAGGCGNGIVDPGEQCDDGNTQPGDGCSSTCTLE